MIFRVTNWRDVFVYSALITVLAVAVPLAMVSITKFRQVAGARLLPHGTNA